MKPIIESPLVMLLLFFSSVGVMAASAMVYEWIKDKRWLRDDRDVLPEPNWRSARGGQDVW